MGNITSAKEYITLESPAGNTIVDEKGSWIFGPYNNLHVEYMTNIIINTYMDHFMKMVKSGM